MIHARIQKVYLFAVSIAILAGICFYSLRGFVGSPTRPPGAYLAAIVREFIAFHVTFEEGATYDSIPDSGRFKTSTDYFKYIVTNGWLHIPDYSVFSLDGVPPAQSADCNQFNSTNNAWCVVIPNGLDLQENAPFLVSRNVSCILPGVPNEIKPFGTNLFIVITWQGRLRIITAAEATPEFLLLPKETSQILFP
jgi:hypothetical protein